MQYPIHYLPEDVALRRIAPAPLAPREMVTDKMLRDYAAIDPLHIADGDDKVMLAGLSMTLADICGELLARRAVMAKGLASLSGASTNDAPAGQRAPLNRGR